MLIGLPMRSFFRPIQRLALQAVITLVIGLTSAPVHAEPAPAPDPAQVCLVTPRPPPPRPQPRPRPKTRTHSPDMVTIGGALMGFFGATGIGLSIAAVATDRPPCGGGWGCGFNFEPLIFGGGAVLAFGHALGIGIPLIVIGAQEKPVDPDSPDRSEQPVMALEVGPGTLNGAW